jgi:hypothetical protein
VKRPASLPERTLSWTCGQPLLDSMAKPSPFLESDEPNFVKLVTEQLAKGASKRRAISDSRYVQVVRERWITCPPDEVYQVKFFVDPLTQPDLVSGFPEPFGSSVDPFCVLVARIGADGELVDAPPEYKRPGYSGVAFSEIVVGSVTGGEVPDPSAPAEYIVAFLDVLGFESLLVDIGLDEMLERYQELLTCALRPSSEKQPWSMATTTVRGELTPGLMWLPIETTYFSDSLLLWVPYHPMHVFEFMERCAAVFCRALGLGIPLRGAISVGRAVLDKSRGIFLGTPLVEAVRLESKAEWAGISLGLSWRSKRIMGTDKLMVYEPPLKDGGSKLSSGLVLDWPRAWRESRDDSAELCLRALCPSTAAESVQKKYAATLAFCQYSADNKDWDLPPGCERVSARELSRLRDQKRV